MFLGVACTDVGLGKSCCRVVVDLTACPSIRNFVHQNYWTMRLLLLLLVLVFLMEELAQFVVKQFLLCLSIDFEFTTAMLSLVVALQSSFNSLWLLN